MTWSKFTLLLLAAYVTYYLLNFLFDAMKNKTVTASTNAGNELTFNEEIPPTEVLEPKAIRVRTKKKKKEIKAIPVQEKEKNKETKPTPVQPEEENGEPASWYRDDEDTEELTIMSTNINTSTGGTTQMSDIIKRAISNTLDLKRQIVY